MSYTSVGWSYTWATAFLWCPGNGRWLTVTQQAATVAVQPGQPWRRPHVQGELLSLTPVQSGGPEGHGRKKKKRGASDGSSSGTAAPARQVGTAERSSWSATPGLADARAADEVFVFTAAPAVSAPHRPTGKAGADVKVEVITLDDDDDVPNPSSSLAESTTTRVPAMSAASSRTAAVTSSTAPICTSPTAAAPTAANCSSSTPVPLREAPTSSAFAAAKAPARDEVFVFTGSGAMGSGPAAPAVAPASTPVSSAATPTVTPVAPPLASAVGPVLAPSMTSAVTPAVTSSVTSVTADGAPANARKRKATSGASKETLDANNNAVTDAGCAGAATDDLGLQPEAKRARTDVVDVPLDKAVRLVGACGGRLVHRTGLDGVGSPYSWPWSWTVQGDARPGDERSPLRFEPLAAGGDEYETIRAAFDDTCRGRGFRVTGICRVENDRLLRLFQHRVRGLEERCGEVAVVRVYHGTLRASVEPICEGNLDPQLAGRASAHTRWGKGVNFSPISYYSSHYCDQQATHRSMLVCDVAMSRVCSARDIGEAPPLPEDAGRVYDTNVKLEPSVQVVCKFADNEFYPAYVIDYAAPPAGHRPEARRRKGRMGRGVVGAPSAYYHQVQPQRVWPWQRGNGDFDDVGGQRQPGYDFTRYSGCNFNFTTSSSFTQYAGYNGFSGYTSYTGFRGYSGYYPSQGAGYHNYQW